MENVIKGDSKEEIFEKEEVKNVRNDSTNVSLKVKEVTNDESSADAPPKKVKKPITEKQRLHLERIRVLAVEANKKKAELKKAGKKTRKYVKKEDTRSGDDESPSDDEEKEFSKFLKYLEKAKVTPSGRGKETPPPKEVPVKTLSPPTPPPQSVKKVEEVGKYDHLFFS